MLRTALRFLSYDKTKSFGALFGVIVATFLIGQQMGVFIFLTDSMKRLVILAPQDIWVVDDKTENVNSLGQLRMRTRYEIESLKGVKSVHPLFFRFLWLFFPQLSFPAAYQITQLLHKTPS